MIRPFILFLSLFFVSSSSVAQTLVPELGRAFQDDRVPRVDIQIAPLDLEFLLDPSNAQSDEYKSAHFYWDDGEKKDTVRFVGFRLRGNTSRNAQKKSFKISFDEIIAGQEFKKLERMNLNGEHNDPSVVRSRLSWDLLRQIGIPGSRVNHVDLYINGDYFGVYANIEMIDDEFVQLRYGNKDGNLYKCLWPADLNYVGADPDLYKEITAGSRQAYTLKINEDEDDYSDLANFIDILNNTPINDLPCELEAVFNVEDYLKAIAFDILIGNWDGPIYNKNNFYLYHNTATDKLEYIPYDLDNTWGIDWLSRDWGTRDMYDWGNHGEPRPIYFRLLEVVQYRERFSYYMFQYLTKYFNEAALNPRFDELRTLLRPSIERDDYYPRDYGYTAESFNNSFESAFSNGHVKYGLKSYLSTRKDNCFSQIQVVPIAPIITQVHNNRPATNQQIAISAMIEANSPVNNVTLNYTIGGSTTLQQEPMFDDGMHDDGLAGDGLYGIFLPALNQSSTINYYIQSSNNTGKTSRRPSCGFREILLSRSSNSLYINEIMASNTTVIADEQGEFDDWIELYNGGTEAINLSGLYLTDNLAIGDKWALPNISIEAGDFLLIWADNDEEQGPLHTSFKLSADGEEVGIFKWENGVLTPIDEMTFGLQQSDMAYGRLPNGTGPFQDLSPTPGASNEPVSNPLSPQHSPLQLSPNPFTNHLLIEFEGAAEVQIRDVQGRLLWQQPFVDQVTWMPEKAAGQIYLLSILKEGKVVALGKVVGQ